MQRPTARANMFRADTKENIGYVMFEDLDNGTSVYLNLSNLTLSPGLHGLHVHESKGNGIDCATMGQHYDNVVPSRNHGDRVGPIRHLGDLGNIIVQPNGTAMGQFFVPNTYAFRNTRQPNGEFIGRGLVLHVGQDDLGQGGTIQSRTNGSVGPAYACGVIVAVTSSTSAPNSSSLNSGMGSSYSSSY